MFLHCFFFFYTKVHMPERGTGTIHCDLLHNFTNYLNIFDKYSYCICFAGTELMKVRGLSTRIVMTTVYLTTNLLYVYYTCFLISNLAVSSGSQPFSTLQGALSVGTYGMGYIKSSSVDETFQVLTQIHNNKFILQKANLWHTLIAMSA